MWPSDLRSATIYCTRSYAINYGLQLCFRKNPVVVNQKKALYTDTANMFAVCSVLGRSYYQVYYCMHCLADTKMHERAFGHDLIASSCWCCMRDHRSKTNYYRYHMSQMSVLLFIMVHC